MPPTLPLGTWRLLFMEYSIIKIMAISGFGMSQQNAVSAYLVQWNSLYRLHYIKQILIACNG